MRSSSIVAVLALVLAAGACSDEEPDAADRTAASSAASEDAAPMDDPVPAGPDTTAAAVWAHLRDAGYESWALWPDKGRLYPGTEPHGMLLTTYLNAAAEAALTSGAAEMPDGAIVVKDNYRPDSTLAATTVMYKVAGYDADHGDWFWAKYGPDGAVEASGRVAPCAECHAQASARDDYLVTRMQQRSAGSGGM